MASNRGLHCLPHVGILCFASKVKTVFDHFFLSFLQVKKAGDHPLVGVFLCNSLILFIVFKD